MRQVGRRGVHSCCDEEATPVGRGNVTLFPSRLCGGQMFLCFASSLEVSLPKSLLQLKASELESFTRILHILVPGQNWPKASAILRVAVER